MTDVYCRRRLCAAKSAGATQLHGQRTRCGESARKASDIRPIGTFASCLEGKKGKAKQDVEAGYKRIP